MMDKSEVYVALQTVFRDVFENGGLTIGPETTAADIAGWDSQAHIALIIAAEQRFSIRFNTATIERLRNVAEFVDLICVNGTKAYRA